MEYSKEKVVRGRVEIGPNGQKTVIWGALVISNPEVNGHGTFTSESGIVPRGTEVEIRVPTGNGRQCFENKGIWKFCQSERDRSGYHRHTIERVD